MSKPIDARQVGLGICLLAGFASGALAGLGTGALLADANPIVGVGSRLALVLGAGLVYGLLLVLPVGLVVFLSTRLPWPGGPSGDRPFGPLLGRGVLVIGLVVALQKLRFAVTGRFDARGLLVALAIAVAALVGGLVLSRLWGLLSRRLGWATALLALLGVVVLGSWLVASRPAPVTDLGESLSLRSASVDEVARAGESRKVALLGFDGLDPVILDALIDGGHLPHFAAARESGTYTPLETLPAGFSPPIWTTFATGVQPAGHRIFDFVTRKVPFTALDLTALTHYPGGLGARTLPELLMRTPFLREALARPGDRRAPAIWTISSVAGLETCVVDWMMTWPSEQVLGVMVGDRAFVAWNLDLVQGLQEYELMPKRLRGELPTLPSDASGHCYPEPRCRALFPNREGERVKPSDLDEFHLAENKFYLDTSENLLSELSCELFVFYSHLPDFINHKLSAAELDNVLAGNLSGPGERTALEAYRQVDLTLGGLRQALGDGRDILVVSDHGVRIVGKGERRRLSHGYPAPPGVFLYLPAEGPAPRLAETPTVYDIAPTVLSFLGLPLTSEMGGRVLDLGAAVGGAERVVQADSLPTMLDSGEPLAESSEMEEELRDRLRALGYIN